jgi:Fatty acid hydroxylase superfamily
MATPAISSGGSRARWSREVKTLPEARRQFLRRTSPWVIGSFVLVLGAVRIAIGDFGWQDAAAAAAMLVIYPFGEWAIHVYLLHMRPVKVGDRKVDTIAARAHRAHHGEPNDLDMILLYWWQAAVLLLIAVPLVVGVVGGIVSLIAGTVPLRVLLTGVLTGWVLVFLYEWTHFLIHTAYRPRSPIYRTIHRNHRLHHFKNEHFWHGVTNNVSDRVLGTNPDQRQVEKSKTARTLDPGAAG